jgi:hypothetical protein
MINERIALVMLDGAVPTSHGDPHHTRQFYKSVQAFADFSGKLCTEGKFKKLQSLLLVAAKLFKDGNETVKNGIVNVYLYTLSRVIDQQPNARKCLEPFMPMELRLAYARMLYSSGM